MLYIGNMGINIPARHAASTTAHQHSMSVHCTHGCILSVSVVKAPTLTSRLSDTVGVTCHLPLGTEQSLPWPS